jgi:predicted NUDIX family NTP pyrophosphohydrolase
MPHRTRKNESAGLLLFRTTSGRLEVFLAHPGGPFWAQKDEGAWTLPKGLVEEAEEPLAAARREFEEETGIRPEGPFLPLGTVRQKAGKLVHAWACEGDAEAGSGTSNLVRVRTPAGWIQVPEVDRCEWFTMDEAGRKLNPAQVAFVDRLVAALADTTRHGPDEAPG